LGTALVAMTPITGACVAWRLLVPHAPAWVLGGLAAAGLITAVYAAAMSLIQTSARRFYCFAFLSHSALVMSGLDPASGISLTASLYLWLSVSLAFTGLGLAVRSLEARTGRLSLKEFQGFQSQTPLLAALFLVAGLAAVGFPGTVGFFGLDLLVEGASEGSPGAGVAIVAAAALNGIGILRAYSALFLGARHPGTVNLRCRPAERLAVLALVALVLGGSIYPQSVVRSRADAARAVLESREGGLPRRDGVTP
jgi:NADH-quinone oxidoreductase subunit M